MVQTGFVSKSEGAKKPTRRFSVVRSREKPPTADVVVAGAFAGLFAESLLHPFDTVSTRLKIKDTHQSYASLVGRLLRTEGVGALWGGASATVACSIPSTALYFYVYENLKSYSPRPDAPTTHLACGAAAELVSSFVHVPFEVVKVRMQLSPRTYKTRYAHALDALWKIAATEGVVGGLYRGYFNCLGADVIFGACQFASYEFLIARFRARSTFGRDGDAARELAAGSLAGGCAAVASNPLDVLASRKMSGLRHLAAGRPEAMSVVQHLFRGTSARVCSAAPLSGLTFAIYEGLRRVAAAG